MSRASNTTEPSGLVMREVRDSIAMPSKGSRPARVNRRSIRIVIYSAGQGPGETYRKVEREAEYNRILEAQIQERTRELTERKLELERVNQKTRWEESP